MSMIYLAEITAAIDAAGTTTVFRYSTQGYNTTPTDTPANTHYAPRILQPALMQRDLFSSGKTYGHSSVSYGELVLSNIDGALDCLIPYSFGGRNLTIKAGDSGAAYGTFSTVLKITMEGADFDDKTVTFRIKDNLLLLDKPLCTNFYLGSNTNGAGLEGGDELAGKAKPVVIGEAYNISPPCVNTSLFVYQANDGTVAWVGAVYDNGVALTQGAVYTSQSDMLANAPAPGFYREYRSGGYFRLYQPAGQITCDVQQLPSVYCSVVELMYQLAYRCGIPNLSNDNGGISNPPENGSLPITYPQFQQYMPMLPGLGGVLVDSEKTTALEVMDTFASAINAWYGFDKNGHFVLSTLGVPITTPVANLTTAEMTTFQKITSRDENKGVPVWKVNVSYLKNYTVQTAGLAGATTTDHRALVRQEYRVQTAPDESIKTQYLNAGVMDRTTSIIYSTDAFTLADFLLTLYKTPRSMYEITLRATPAMLLSIDLGGVVNVVYPRFNLSAGQLLTVVGLRADLRNNSLKLTLWG